MDFIDQLQALATKIQRQRDQIEGRRSQIDQLGGPSVRQFGNVIRN